MERSAFGSPHKELLKYQRLLPELSLERPLKGLAVTGLRVQTRVEKGNIMANIIINNNARTIEINKTFAAKASIYGSDEYVVLQKARRDYPNYYVVDSERRRTATV